MKLTDRFCETVKPTEGKPQADFFDETVPGLALRVGRRGKSWTLHFGTTGSRRRLTLGAYPAVSLGAARRKALEAKGSIADGRAPAPTDADALKAICEDYLARNPGRSTGQYSAALRRLVYPVLGHRPIGEIRRSEIVRLLDGIEDQNGPVMADLVLSIVRRIMNWHSTRDDDFISPIVRGMRRSKSQKRSRILSDEELRKVWHCDAALTPLVRFLLLTGARRSEAVGMTLAELSQGDWLLPAARNKTKLDLLRPLSPAAMAILTEGGQDRPFPFKRNLSTAKLWFDVACGVRGWTFHDCRRTARSLMSRAGVPSDHAERCLGHVIGGVRGVYDRHEYKAEKAEAYIRLSQLIASIVGAHASVKQPQGELSAERTGNS